MCLNTFIYFFAFIGLFMTIYALMRQPDYKTVCEYKNAYTYNDYSECLMKNGCGSDGSLCSEQKPYWFCSEPEIECKLIKNYDL
jgi:hypothetical protein